MIYAKRMKSERFLFLKTVKKNKYCIIIFLEKWWGPETLFRNVINTSVQQKSIANRFKNKTYTKFKDSFKYQVNRVHMYTIENIKYQINWVHILLDRIS